MEIIIRNQVVHRIKWEIVLQSYIIIFYLLIKSYKSISILYDSAIPGIIVAILTATTVSDPAKDERYEILMGNIDDDYDDDDEIDEEDNDKSNSSHSNRDLNEDANVRKLILDDSSENERSRGSYVARMCSEFCDPTMLCLALAATFRQCAGFSWAYNTKPYFLKYYPGFDISYWILACSLGGGSFGVFFGGFLSDRVVRLNMNN